MWSHITDLLCFLFTLLAAFQIYLLVPHCPGFSLSSSIFIPDDLIYFHGFKHHPYAVDSQSHTFSPDLSIELQILMSNKPLTCPFGQTQLSNCTTTKKPIITGNWLWFAQNSSLHLSQLDGQPINAEGGVLQI